MSKKIAQQPSRAEHKTLVMLSGGIDSTAALWYVLGHPEVYGAIHVHHIHIQNEERRWEVEAMAVNAIYEYLKKHSPTPFVTSESVIGMPSFKGNFMWDIEAIGFTGGYMTSLDPSITKIVLGVTSTDWERSSIPDTVARSKATHNAFHRDADDHSGQVKVFPLKDMTKQQAYNSLPAELAQLTWSCRRPHFHDGVFIECGVCKTCRGELRDIKRRARGEA